MASKKDWIKKKNMTPEEKKAYEHYQFEFSNRYFKAHTILFFVWLIVLTVGYVFQFKGPQLSDVGRLVFTTLHTLWSVAGLTATLVFDHCARKYAQEHLHEPYDTGDDEDTIRKIEVVIEQDGEEKAEETPAVETDAEPKPEEASEQPKENPNDT